MTRKLGVLVFGILVCSLLAARAADDKAGAASNTMEGTWQLVQGKYGDAAEFASPPADTRRVKVINKSHFVWVEAGPKGEVRSMAGGPYTLKDGTYTEVIEFGTEGTAELNGKEQVFKITFKGDTYQQTGSLSNGFKIDEIWKRVK